MLRTRLLKYFGFLVVLFGVVSALVGVDVIRTQVIQRAETQVRSDLNSAWSVVNGEMEKLERTLRLTADGEHVVEACNNGTYAKPELRKYLETVRMRYGFDFLSILNTESQVTVRSAPPYNRGDFFVSEPALRAALKGKYVTGLTLLNRQQLELECADLGERAYMVREETPRARPSVKKNESRGMVMLSAVPVIVHNNVRAVLYGGVLVNRNEELVERIHHSVYRADTAAKTGGGTVTAFLKDLRVATTVRTNSGHLALGTLVSKEVADQVLDNGKPWFGRAFVVRDWYLTAYDPIKNLAGEVIGMLYVGIPEKPFTDTIKATIFRYALLLFAGILITLVFAFFFAAHVASPLHELADAAERMRSGKEHVTVRKKKYSTETRILIDAFNAMAEELTHREATLRDMNGSLAATNRNYMETLGFISHELKTPLGTIMNFAYLLGEQKLGELNEKQVGAVKTIDANTKRITEMVRHYLNLSRIERDELLPKPALVTPRNDIVEGLATAFKMPLEEKGMRLENNIPADTSIYADYNMTMEIFENIISNAIKYGDNREPITINSKHITGMIEFTIRNTGKGIAKEDIDAVFDKFVRVGGPNGGQKKIGTGLGLFITKQIVEAHCGTIEARSEEGEWTEFVFTLPYGVEGDKDGNNKDDDSNGEGAGRTHKSNMAAV